MLDIAAIAVVVIVLGAPVWIPLLVWGAWKEHKKEQQEFSNLLYVAEELGKMKAEYEAKEQPQPSEES